MELREVFIVGGVRTAIGKMGGSLASVRADDLAATVIQALVSRYAIPGASVDEVILGCANQAGEDNRNIARMASLLAGLPVTVPAFTVNRLCASGMSAVVDGARQIQTGEGDLVVAGGIEHMTRAPWVMSKSARPFGNDVQLHDSSFGWRFVNAKMNELYGTEAMGETAENLADLYAISRKDQDLFAFRSQQKATVARDSGRLAKEIVTVITNAGTKHETSFLEDEFIKATTSLDVLATLRPAFRKEAGTVTAGNASGLNDGAAALLLASRTAVDSGRMQPLARFIASASAGVEPRIMGIGPVDATQKLLGRTGLTLADIDIIEINEAFAAQVLACTRQLGLADDDPRVNPNGGAIALGHPLGMSGARLLLTAALELQEKKGRYAICTMCVGVGQGVAVLIERI